MKWLWIILLIVVGIVAAVFAFEYLTTGIGHLPSWVPGHIARTVPVNGNCPKGTNLKDGYCYAPGHEHKRGYGAALVAVLAFVGAGWLIYKNQTAATSAAGPAS